MYQLTNFRHSPPPLSPDQDPDRGKEQEQDKEQTKKKYSRPVPLEEKNEFVEQKEQLKHNWDKREGHVEKTPENEKLIHDVANNPNGYLGPSNFGNHWYAKLLANGKQVWVKVRNNKIINWGINKAKDIKKYNPNTDLSTLKVPRKKISGKKS